MPGRPTNRGREVGQLPPEDSPVNRTEVEPSRGRLQVPWVLATPHIEGPSTSPVESAPPSFLPSSQLQQAECFAGGCPFSLAAGALKGG